MSDTTNNIISLANLLKQKRAERVKAKEVINVMTEEIDDLEKQLVALLENADMSAVSGTEATYSLSKREVPTVDDWAKFYEYIDENKWYHLLERRPSVSGCQEIWASEEQIPGVSSFTKKSIRITSKR